MIINISTQHFANGFGLFGDIEELKKNIAKYSDEEVEKQYRTCAFLQKEFSYKTRFQYYLEVSKFDKTLAEKRLELDDEIVKFLENTITNRKRKKQQEALSK